MDQGIKKESIPCFSLKYSRKIRFLIYENWIPIQINNEI
jgi:hypothetical protein